MKLRDFINQEIDIDVYDDVCDGIGIAFCGPQHLTEEGAKQFDDIMDLEVSINPCSWGGLPCAIVHIDDPCDHVWMKRQKRCELFFWACAGYIDCDIYDKWFPEED